MTTAALKFDLYPAIDLRNGQVVRLQLGDPTRQTTFSSDPLAVANQWIESGATWLHVVNLDGAFNETGQRNWRVLPQLTGLSAPVQFGGGLRSMEDINRAIDFGVSRVVLGTTAVEQPDIVSEAIHRFGPERIAIGIDARDGKVKTRGWQNETTTTPIELGRQMAALGAYTIIYTDISRDGILSGVNAQATIELAKETGLNVIASGGVASLSDVRRALAGVAAGVSGLIIGRALYDGKINLREALTLTKDDRTNEVH